MSGRDIRGTTPEGAPIVWRDGEPMSPSAAGLETVEAAPSVTPLAWVPTGNGSQVECMVGDARVLVSSFGRFSIQVSLDPDHGWLMTGLYVDHAPTDAEVLAWLAIVERHHRLMHAEMTALVGPGGTR